MARDKGLEDLIRNDLPRGLSVTEKAMFGGMAWLVDGNLALGARGDGMLARLGKGNDAWAVALPDVGRMISAGRPMQGWVRAGPLAYGDDAVRARLIEAALTFVKGCRRRVSRGDDAASLEFLVPPRTRRAAPQKRVVSLFGIVWISLDSLDQNELFQ